MSKILSSTGGLITKYVTEAIVTPRANKIYNTLLDGTNFVQTIGTPHKIALITCSLTELGKEGIDDAYMTDSPLRLEWQGKYYEGIIQEEIEYMYLSKGSVGNRLYTATFTLMIGQEGSL